jgi:hypothetical protein
MQPPEVELYLVQQLAAFLFHIRLGLGQWLRQGLEVRVSRWANHRRRKSQSPESLWWWGRPIEVYRGYRRHRRWHIWGTGNDGDKVNAQQQQQQQQQRCRGV